MASVNSELESKVKIRIKIQKKVKTCETKLRLAQIIPKLIFRQRLRAFTLFKKKLQIGQPTPLGDDDEIIHLEQHNDNKRGSKNNGLINRNNKNSNNTTLKVATDLARFEVIEQLPSPALGGDDDLPQEYF